MQRRRKRAKRTESQVTRFFTFEYVKASSACSPCDAKCLQESGLPSLEASLVTRNQLRSIDKTITRDDEPFSNGYRFVDSERVDMDLWFGEGWERKMSLEWLLCKTVSGGGTKVEDAAGGGHDEFTGEAGRG